VRDVLHEDAVRTYDEDAAQLGAVRVEQIRRPVQADGRLSRSRAALDREGRVRIPRDQRVLIGLDGRDDVAHVRVA
jgi:hypothetical protein